MIRVEGLTKYYGERAAIADLNFSIERGEVIGFLGLNGAGKTTTLRVLGCVLLPTSGRVEIDGIDIEQDAHEIRRRTGFLPDTPPLYPEMTVGGYLSFVAALRGVSSKEVASRVAEVEGQTALSDKHDEVIGSLSHGYKQRVGVAQAIVHNPALLILDEPSSGLDPAQIVEMRKLIGELRGKHTILLSSHNLHEISETCDRLLVIQEGRIIAQGREEELAQLAGGNRVEIELRPVASAPTAKIVAALRSVKDVGEVRVKSDDRHSVALEVAAAATLRPAIVRALISAGADVLRVDQAAGGGLESIFLQLTREGKN